MNLHLQIRKLAGCFCAALLFLTSGCVTTDSSSGGLVDIGLELVTKVAINESLRGDVQLASDVRDAANLFIESIDTGVITTPLQVDEAVFRWIADTDLTPASKASLSATVATLKRHYLARIDAGQLDSEVTASLRTVLTWVRDAAEDTIRFGAGFEYDAPSIPLKSAAKFELTS